MVWVDFLYINMVMGHLVQLFEFDFFSFLVQCGLRQARALLLQLCVS